LAAIAADAPGYGLGGVSGTFDNSGKSRGLAFYDVGGGSYGYAGNGWVFVAASGSAGEKR
jgi:hypothetical protein